MGKYHKYTNVQKYKEMHKDWKNSKCLCSLHHFSHKLFIINIKKNKMKLMLILLYKQYLHLIQCLHKFPFRLSSSQALLLRNGNNFIYLILELRRNGNKLKQYVHLNTILNFGLIIRTTSKVIITVWNFD